jgi:hypothetical protein
MSKYTIGANQNLYALMRLLDTNADNDITLKFSAESEVYKNSLNLKTLKKLAEDKGKTLKFEVENPKHKDYIDAVNGDYIEYNDEQVNLEDTIEPAAKAGMLAGLMGMFKRNKSDSSEYTEVEGEDESVQVEGSSEYAPEEKPVNTKKRKLIKTGIIAAVAVLLLVSIAWAFFWYVPTATVKITVDAKGLIKLIDVKASTNQATVSAESMSIPAFSIETSETDSQKIPTTGTKQTGDMASGKIKITNKTNKKVTIDKDSEVKLISSDKDALLYKTTDKIELDAYTEDSTTHEKSFKSGDVKVKATNFGSEYNLGDSEKFKVDGKDTDEIVAESSGKIDGGSSKEVKVVSQADLDTLKRTTEDFMKDKVQRALSQKLVAGQVMQESSVEFNTAKADYSKQLDEEADEVSLQMTMAGKVLAYDDASLDTLMKDVVKTVVPESFNLDDDNPEYEVAATSVSNGTDVNLQVKLTSSITPRLDESKIKEDLSGMAIDQAQEYLDNLNDVKGFEISISPNLPGIFLRMPERSQNIYIVVNK